MSTSANFGQYIYTIRLPHHPICASLELYHPYSPRHQLGQTTCPGPIWNSCASCAGSKRLLRHPQWLMRLTRSMATKHVYNRVADRSRWRYNLVKETPADVTIVVNRDSCEASCLIPRCFAVGGSVKIKEEVRMICTSYIFDVDACCCVGCVY